MQYVKAAAAAKTGGKCTKYSILTTLLIWPVLTLCELEMILQQLHRKHLVLISGALAVEWLFHAICSHSQSQGLPRALCPHYDNSEVHWVFSWILYAMCMFQYLDFFCFLVAITLSEFFVRTFSFFFLSGLLWWLVPPLSSASEQVGCEGGPGSQMGSSGRLFSGTLVLTWDLLMSGVIICCLLAWDDWMGQGNTSQRKCMWAGKLATGRGWESKDPDATRAGNGDGPGTWKHDAYGSDWEAITCGCVEYSFWVLCWCCRQCMK